MNGLFVFAKDLLICAYMHQHVRVSHMKIDFNYFVLGWLVLVQDVSMTEF